MSRRFRALVVHPAPEQLADLISLLGLELIVDLVPDVAQARGRIDEARSNPDAQYSVLLSAHDPTGVDGIAFLESTTRTLPTALRILLVADPAHAVELDVHPRLDTPIMRCIARPGETSRIVGLISEGTKLLRMLEAQRDMFRQLGVQYRDLKHQKSLLEVAIKERDKELRESYIQLKEANRQALFGLAEAIEAKDPYTKGHCGRVAAFTLVLAQEAGYPDADLEMLEFGAFLHDIGKLGTRDSVLLKPGPLDDEEWEHMRQHPIRGDEIASKIEMLRPIIPMVRNHHERWDGTGYPDGMRGEDIPIEARMVAIADAYDAMASDRPYKHGLPLAECERILRKTAGTMYDPELVEIFVSRHIGELYRDDYPGEPYADPYHPASEPGEPAREGDREL